MLRFLDSTLWGKDERDDKTVKGKGFSENQDQDHSDKNFILLRVGSHTRITHNTDGQTCSLKLFQFLPMN